MFVYQFPRIGPVFTPHQISYSFSLCVAYPNNCQILVFVQEVCVAIKYNCTLLVDLYPEQYQMVRFQEMCMYIGLAIFDGKIWQYCNF